MRHLLDLDVVVLGLGESGLAMARWAVRCGARVRVWDSREQPPHLATLQEVAPAARFVRELPAIDGVQLVLKSPGLAPSDPRIAPLMEAARARGIAIQGELDLFAQALADLKAERGYAPRVLAITGTNGKTTTTALTTLLVERAGRRVAGAGNIGPTMLDTLAAALDLEPEADAPDALAQADDAAEAGEAARPGEGVEIAVWSGEVASEDLTSPASPVGETLAGEEDAATAAAPEGQAPDDREPAAADGEPAAPALAPEAAAEDAARALPIAPPPPAAPVFEHLPEVWVLELSSFQLEGVRGFEPSAAVVLNVSQDHLDWHGTMDDYVAAKRRIYGETAVMVVNRDDPRVEAMVPPPVMVKGGRGRAAKAVSRKVVRFGLDAPRHPGDFGLVVENGMAWLVRALESDETVRRRRDEVEEIHLQRLMPADALRIRGRHNAANALAALALATAIGCPLAPMLHGLREYRGEPHRVEPVGTVYDVEAFDDSKGTNVGATVAALLGLGADKAPAKLVVILGGDGKGQDFRPLVEPIARHARAVALIGRDADAIAAALAASGVPMQRHDSLQAATRWAFHQAQPGDAVLLSPACASLDMFRNYAHRAEVFVAEVHAIAAEAGETLL